MEVVEKTIPPMKAFLEVVTKEWDLLAVPNYYTLPNRGCLAP